MIVNVLHVVSSDLINIRYYTGTQNSLRVSSLNSTFVRAVYTGWC